MLYTKTLLTQSLHTVEILKLQRFLTLGPALTGLHVQIGYGHKPIASLNDQLGKHAK